MPHITKIQQGLLKGKEYSGDWKACPRCGRGTKLGWKTCGYCSSPYAWLEPKAIETKEVTENKESRLHPGDIKA